MGDDGAEAMEMEPAERARGVAALIAAAGLRPTPERVGDLAACDQETAAVACARAAAADPVLRAAGRAVSWAWAAVLDLAWAGAVGAVLWLALRLAAGDGIAWAGVLLARVDGLLAAAWKAR